MKHNSYELLNPRLKVVVAEDNKLPALDGSLLTNLPGGELVAGVSSIGGKDGVITLSTDLTMSAASQLQVAGTIARNTAAQQNLVSTSSFDISATSYIKLAAAGGNITIEGADGHDIEFTEANAAVFQIPVTLTGGITTYKGYALNTANSLVVLDASGKIAVSMLPVTGLVTSIGGAEGAITLSSDLAISSGQLGVSSAFSGSFVKKSDATQFIEASTGDFNITATQGNLMLSVIGADSQLNVSGKTVFNDPVSLLGGISSYNGNAPNTANSILVLGSDGKVGSQFLPEIPESGVISIAGKKGNFTVDSTLTVSAANQISVAAGVFMKLTNTSDVVATTTGSFSFTANSGSIQFSSTSNEFTGQVTMSDAVTMSSAVAITGPLTYGGAAMNAANGIPTLDAQGKIKTAQIPPVALTEVLPVEADGTSDLNTLLRKAATDKGLSEVQSGEIIVIQRPAVIPDPVPPQSYWDGVCGNYLVKETIAVTSLTSANCIKTYMPDVTITVNEVSAVDGNITLNLENLADVSSAQATLLKSIQVNQTVPSIQGIRLATEEQIKHTYTITRYTIALDSLSTVDTTWPDPGEFYAYRNDGVVTVRVNRASVAGATVARTFLEAWLITGDGKEYVMPDITFATQGEGNSVGLTYLVLTLDFGSGHDFTGASLEIGTLSPVVATA